MLFDAAPGCCVAGVGKHGRMLPFPAARADLRLGCGIGIRLADIAVIGGSFGGCRLGGFRTNDIQAQRRSRRYARKAGNPNDSPAPW